MAFYSTLRQKLRVLASTPYNWTLPAADAAGTINSDGSGTLSIATAVVPGGSDTYVQFKDGAGFGGDAGLVYNKSTDALTVAGPLAVGGIATITGVATINNSLLVNQNGVSPIGLKRESATVGHGVGLSFQLGNSAAATAGHLYGSVATTIAVNTDGAEAGNFILNLSQGGSEAEMLRLFGATGNLSLGTTTDSGKLNVVKDVDTACYFGKGYISSTGTSMTADRAHWGHVDNETASTYAIMQTADGNTNLNAKTGQRVWFLVNAAGQGSWDATGLHIGDSTAPAGRLTVKDIGGAHSVGVVNIQQDDNNVTGLHIQNLSYDTGLATGARLSVVGADGNLEIRAPDDGSDPGDIVWFTDEAVRLTLYASGGDLRLENDMTIVGDLAVSGTKAFVIKHPHPDLHETHNLRYGCYEGPVPGGLIYQGRVRIDGATRTASVDMDETCGIHPGTFALLADVDQATVLTSNEEGFCHVTGRLSVDPAGLTQLLIECSTEVPITCTDEIAWVVVGERRDAGVLLKERPVEYIRPEPDPGLNEENES